MPFHRVSGSHVLCALVLNADTYSYILRTRCMRQTAICARRKKTLPIDSRFSWKSPSNKWFVIEWQFRMYIKENQDQTNTQSLFMCSCGKRRLGLGWGARGLMERDEGSRAGRFFKGNGTFLVFFVLKILWAFISLFFLSIKKFSLWSKKYFYAFCGVLVVSLAWCARGKIPLKAMLAILTVLLVNCGLKVGNCFLYFFSFFGLFLRHLAAPARTIKYLYSEYSL